MAMTIQAACFSKLLNYSVTVTPWGYYICYVMCVMFRSAMLLSHLIVAVARRLGGTLKCTAHKIKKAS